MFCHFIRRGILFRKKLGERDLKKTINIFPGFVRKVSQKRNVVLFLTLEVE